MSERRFRIMEGPSVPWRLVEPYADQAKANHDQTLERLNERGGLSPGELWCLVHGKRWGEQPAEAFALHWLHCWLAEDGRAQDQATIAQLRAALTEAADALECGPYSVDARLAEWIIQKQHDMQMPHWREHPIGKARLALLDVVAALRLLATKQDGER